MEEIYRAIPGYEGKYEVSNFGNVKTLSDRYAKHRILKPGISSGGYYNVGLTKDNKRNNFTNHQLVAMAFLNHKPNNYQIVVDHIDGNKLNNYIDNLQLITNRYNCSKDKIDCTSNYTGIVWHKQRNKWQSQIRINSKQIHLGTFEDEMMASEMYQIALANIDKYTNPKEFRTFLKSLLIVPQPLLD